MKTRFAGKPASRVLHEENIDQSLRACPVECFSRVLPTATPLSANKDLMTLDLRKTMRKPNSGRLLPRTVDPRFVSRAQISE